MTMEMRLEDLNRCCRCCLVTVNTLKPLFGGYLDEMLKKLMNFEVTQNDGYPQLICPRCILKLSSAHTFYLTVRKSHETLGNILKTAKENGEPPTAGDSCEQKELNTWEEEEEDALDKLPYVQSQQSEQDSHAQETLCVAEPESENKHPFDNEEGSQCPQCEHTSKDQEHLKAHLRTHLGADMPEGGGVLFAHLCNYCGARFRWRTSLFKHVRRHRGLVRQCPHCPKNFAETSTLNVHLVSHSVDNPKPFHCTKCDRSFTQKSSLKKHEEQHTARQTLKCHDCEKSFLYKSSLQRHRESAHIPDECPLCKKLFSGKKFLDAHMRCHKKDEMARLKTEPVDSTMEESINIQAVTVEYLCLICSNKFQSRKSLEVHICSKNTT